MSVQQFERIDICADYSMFANEAFGESGYWPDNCNNDSNSSTCTVSIWPLAVPHNCPSLLVLLFTWKRTVVKAFAAGKLSCCTILRAKPVVAGSMEPVNMVVAEGAATKIADSDNKIDGNRGTSHGAGSGKAAIDKDTTMRNELVNNGTGGQVLGHGGDGPQPAK